MSAHTRKLEERRARALARRAELGAENRAPEMNAPWALGEREAPRKAPPAAAPVATDAPPTPRDLARANASRNAGDKDSRANFFTGAGAQAPASTGKRQFGLSSQTSSDLIGGPSSPERRPARSSGATLDARAQYAIRANAARGAKRSAAPEPCPASGFYCPGADAVQEHLAQNITPPGSKPIIVRVGAQMATVELALFRLGEGLVDVVRRCQSLGSPRKSMNSKLAKRLPIQSPAVVLTP